MLAGSYVPEDEEAGDVSFQFADHAMVLEVAGDLPLGSLTGIALDGLNCGEVRLDCGADMQLRGGSFPPKAALQRAKALPGEMEFGVAASGLGDGSAEMTVVEQARDSFGEPRCVVGDPD